MELEALVFAVLLKREKEEGVVANLPQVSEDIQSLIFIEVTLLKVFLWAWQVLLVKAQLSMSQIAKDYEFISVW